MRQRYVDIETSMWMQWIAATAVAAMTMSASLIVFAYSEFQTVDSAKEFREIMIKRLDRIEAKVDLIKDSNGKKE